MNKNILAGVVLATLAISANAQGSLAFSSASGTKPRITVDGVNAGTGIKVELLVAGATGLTYSSSGAAVEAFNLKLTGANAGLFSQGVVLAGGVAPDATKAVTIRAWDTASGDSFASATTKASTTFDYKFGGAGEPPGLPGSIVGANLFNGLALTSVPEPSTYALAALGLGGLMFLRRK